MVVGSQVEFVTFLYRRKAHAPCRARCVRCKLKAKLCAVRAVPDRQDTCLDT